MGRGATEVDVYYDDSHLNYPTVYNSMSVGDYEDRYYVHDESHQQVLRHEWNRRGGRREDFRDKQQEHHQRQKNGNCQSDLLIGLRRKVEDQHARP